MFVDVFPATVIAGEEAFLFVKIIPFPSTLFVFEVGVDISFFVHRHRRTDGFKRLRIEHPIPFGI